MDQVATQPESSSKMHSVVYFLGLSITLYFFLSMLYRLGRGLWNLKLGATDGIGLAYSHELLKRGYNLLLISRTASKLQAVKEECNIKYNKLNREIRVHTADFAKTDIYDGIEKEIKKLPRVDVLVNNVGVSYEHPEYFASSKLNETNQAMLLVNSMSCSRMCYIVLPIMEQQKYGVILNVSSFSALFPTPLLSMYAATKAFVDVFSRSIAYEYAKKGIIVQSVLPGFVVTKMSKIRKAYWMAPTPQDYVRAQLNTVGLDSQTTGFWSHELRAYFVQHVFPIIHGPSLASIVAFNQMKLLRHKALKKVS